MNTPRIEERTLRLSDGSIGPVRVSRAGEGLWRLEEDPLLTEECRLGDLIAAAEGADGELVLQRVVEKGPWRTMVFTLSKEIAESPRLGELLEQLYAEGGQWDRVFGGMLYVHLPRGRRLNAGRALFNYLRSRERRHP